MQDIEQHQFMQAYILVIMSCMSYCHIIYSEGAQRMLLPLACASHALQGLLCATSEGCVCACECRKDGDVYRSLLEVAQRSPFNDTEEGPAWKPVLEARLNPNARANAKL